ncbi:MAG TPA: AAA family ATPase [Plasticicumulans sp.]|uniref:AAA family ATPase n=1 Tax=Plasticicumulans sp. TaxID=2307179 RepID=UPI002C778DDD|nr:AAA family ATPase [Plasticicumulans sp.]HMW31402.1 AAA family ATPase [Plasticicumulans sp.]
MRLHSLDLTNFGPHRHLSLPLAPLTVVTGGNGTGKSHIAEALRLALAGDWMLRGLMRKGDRTALLSDGAEAGSIVVEAADGFRAAVNIKTGKVERTPGPVAYLEQCCDPRLIVDQPTADLRAMLLDLLQIDINRVGMQAELIARGHDPDLVGAWVCGQDCATAASEARGAWKAATGEVYGMVKAAAWTAPKPGFDPDELARVDAEHTKQSARLAALREEATTAREAERARDRLAGLRAHANDQILIERAGEAETLRARLAEAQSAPLPPAAAQDEAVRNATADLSEARRAVTAAAAEKLNAEAAQTITPCPHCAGPLLVADGAIRAADPAAPARDQGRIAAAVRALGMAKEAEAAASKRHAEAVRAADSRYSTALSARDANVAAASAALTTAEDAARTLASARAALEAADLPPPPRPSAELDAEIAELVARVEALDQQRKALREAEKAIARADDITARAAAAYADVQAWVALDDAVEALPNEMLAAGLAPLNALLRELAGHARPDLFVTPRGLPLVPSVSPDMSIRCGHRPYHAFSDSERWRIDALLGAAVASLSGHRLLVLDEADMLQPGLRPSLLGWLDALVTAGHLETALVMATTREPFRVPKHVAQFRLPAAAAGEEAAA